MMRVVAYTGIQEEVVVNVSSQLECCGIAAGVEATIKVPDQLQKLMLQSTDCSPLTRPGSRPTKST